jgi:hypothetical protein
MHKANGLSRRFVFVFMLCVKYWNTWQRNFLPWSLPWLTHSRTRNTSSTRTAFGLKQTGLRFKHRVFYGCEWTPISSDYIRPRRVVTDTVPRGIARTISASLHATVASNQRLPLPDQRPHPGSGIGISRRVCSLSTYSSYLLFSSLPLAQNL